MGNSKSWKSYKKYLANSAGNEEQFSIAPWCDTYTGK